MTITTLKAAALLAQKRGDTEAKVDLEELLAVLADCEGRAQAPKVPDAAELLAALEDSLVMIGRLKKHCQITDNAGYTADGRMLTLTGVEERARAALASAKREGKACSGD